jgi:hypothetical protein
MFDVELNRSQKISPVHLRSIEQVRVLFEFSKYSLTISCSAELMIGITFQKATKDIHKKKNAIISEKNILT